MNRDDGRREGGDREGRDRRRAPEGRGAEGRETRAEGARAEGRPRRGRGRATPANRRREQPRERVAGDRERASSSGMGWVWSAVLAVIVAVVLWFVLR